MDWQLKGGVWSEAEFLMEPKDGEDSFEDTLQRLGFEKYAQIRIGEVGICDVEIHVSACGARFIASVGFISNIINVHLPTFPDLLEFFKQVEPIVRLNTETAKQEREA